MTSNDMEPRGLSQQRAAQYVGVSLSAFLELVGEGRMPPPIFVGGHLLWDRHAIDRYFETAGANTPDMKTWRDLLHVAGTPTQQESAPPLNPRKRKRFKSWTDMPPGPERDRKMAREESKWRAEVRRSPLGKMERVALWELYRRRGSMTDANMMRGVTFRIHKTIIARGYVSTQKNQRGHVEYWQINAKGIQALKGIPEEAPPQFTVASMRKNSSDHPEKGGA